MHQAQYNTMHWLSSSGIVNTCWEKKKKKQEQKSIGVQGFGNLLDQ
jgi:hypothetical protein